ncbi:MAG: hypothetical protein U9R75_06770, partial [Candidatus Thermoplasmatota archaeon]|nr:hypothetical protein [Candidatus Thermoplasmatota archaeon]
ENSSITVVPIGTYLDMDYILTETIPPVVESVDILQSGISTDTLEWGSQAMIRVREKYNEADLTGRVDVSKVGSTTPDQSMDLAENGSFYEVIWNTSRLQPGERYGLEANLVDHLGNIDDNGSDPEGYDRTVDIVDTTPPFIYTVQLLGDRNEDGSFELGSTISVEVYVKGGAHDEPSLKGNMTCSGISSTLKWAPGTDLLWGVIDTERTGKGTFNMIIRVSDGFDNEIIERIDLTVKDTTPPEFSLTMIEDSVEPIPAGSLLHLMLQPLEPDENLSASIQLLTRVDGEPTILEEFHNLIRSSGGYKFEWNTSGMQTGTFYLEGRLRDGEGNMLSTGALPGWDLSVRIVDLTPPEIESVWIEGFRIPQGERLTMMGTFDVQVRSTQMEPGMGCFLEISRDGSPVLDPIELGSDGNRTFVTSLNLVYPGFYTYDLEFSLGDRWGNIDPDGYGPGPDLTINYTRGRIQENITGRVDDHSWSSFEQGFVITGERVIMETYLTNITSGDGIYLIYNGIRSDLAPLREVRDNLTYLRVSFPTDLITGEQRLWWRIDLYDLGVLESRTLKFNVIDGKRGPVEQISIINWSDIDRGHISLNMTWHVPALASELWFRIYYMDSSGSFSVNISFDPGTSSVSIDVERRNLTIEVVAVHYLFPDHASRNVTMHIMDQKISRLEFSPPGWKEEEVPDERRDEGTEILPFILAAVVLIFVLAIASMIISRSKKGRLPELEME